VELAEHLPHHARGDGSSRPAGGNVDVRLAAAQAAGRLRAALGRDGRAGSAPGQEAGPAARLPRPAPAWPPQGRDSSAGLFWGDSGDAQARTSLRQALAVLRRQLGPHGEGLITAPEGETVALAEGRLATDVAEFEACLASGARDALEQAVALYGGELLEGFRAREPLLEEWLVGERQRLREAALGAMAALLPEAETAGPPEAGIRLALRILALDPLQRRRTGR
jgi:hypothetical protein